MIKTELFKRIASEIQIFKTVDKKANFIFVIGALTARVISLQKAAEIMEIEEVVGEPALLELQSPNKSAGTS